jgi:DNA polymerase III epsilon subunit-like protein
MAEAKTVLYDLETTHNLAAVFRLANEDYIPPENIVAERYIVCASWKVLGESKIHSVSTLDNRKLFKKDPSNDAHVCEVLHDVLAEADVIVAHNGDRYDLKFAETRMLFHGIDPLPPITSIDTLKVAKDRFLFNSNKLDYLGNFLGVGRKKHTTAGLWLEVLRGNEEAIEEMIGYNKQDVALLERVFQKLQPYMKDHLNRELLSEGGCPRCGSKKVQSRGVHKAISRTYRRFQCKGCGGWFREATSTTGTKTKSRVL